MNHSFMVTLKAKSPVHVGYGVKLGVVSRTRYYIPTKNIWAALTNVLTKSIMDEYSAQLYEDVGNALKENMRFSYFFVSSGDTLFAPRFDSKEGLKYGDVGVEAFEQRFISSHISTALEKSSKSAEEGSLHEIEFIRPAEHGKVFNPVKYKGYFFAKEKRIQLAQSNDFEVNDLEGMEIQVGGERSYGFGKLVIERIEEIQNTKDHCFFGDLDLETAFNGKLVLRAKKSTFALYAHMPIDCASMIKRFWGDLEPLIGREWDREKGAGQKQIGSLPLCFMPGTIIEAEGGTEIEVTEQGLWRLLPPQR